MAPQVNGLLGHGADIAVASRSNIVKAVGRTPAVWIAGEFIHIPSGLKAEMLEYGEADLLSSFLLVFGLFCFRFNIPLYCMVQITVFLWCHTYRFTKLLNKMAL